MRPEEATRAPFPWFGGKSAAAELIWSRFGADDLGTYLEPFLGSAAVFLRRPAEFSGWITLNDFDGHLVNFWRSVSTDPIRTAEAASQPVFEADLHARHLRLVREHGRLAARLMADPDYCEPLLAGWWAWGACVWIGGGWCAGGGPWTSVPDDEGVPAFSRDGGTGVNRKLPRLDPRGAGLLLPQLGGEEAARLGSITAWFQLLRDNFRGARVACGDWQRVMSPGTLTRNGPCAVLLDPPYSQTAAVYAHDSSTIAHDVRSWCLANGKNRELRIALCGHVTEHDELEHHGWTVETWGKKGGYQGADERERIWFSPHCIQPATTPELF